jgi:signal transduction histidine kinase
MTPAADPELAADPPPASGRPGGYPFRGPGLSARVWPFAAVAVLAEASLVLPPGPTSTWAAVSSAVLLVAVAAAFLLPWPQLPGWVPVLVPLAYTGSVLALILATGPTSGVGIVILVPLIWTALFQQSWESACVVVAIVAVEVVISLTPVAVPDAVIARRVVLWSALGAVVSVSTHGLRDRIRRAREQAARLQDRLREASIVEDRDRIASDLRDRVIQQVFAAGLTLQSVAMRTTDQDMRDRIGKTIDDLDHAVVILRDTVYGLHHRLEVRGLRSEILRLCEELNVAPELSFSGPVDGALHPRERAGLFGLLRDALPLIGQHFVPARMEITAGRDSFTVVVEATPLAGATGTTGLTVLKDIASQAGFGLDIEPDPEATRFAWRAHTTVPR